MSCKICEAYVSRERRARYWNVETCSPKCARELKRRQMKEASRRYRQRKKAERVAHGGSK